MASRWRTWDLGALDEMDSYKKDDIEPFILPGWRKKITHVDLSAIVLPKEAYFSCDDVSRARGRGRSLTNRALGYDKPSRRPGERDSFVKSTPTCGTVKEKPKTLGSKFLGSEYLYEEQFPSLEQPTKTDTKLSIKESKRKGKKGKSGRLQDNTEVKINKNTNDLKEEICQEEYSDGSDNLKKSEDKTTISDQFSDQLGFNSEENLNPKDDDFHEADQMGSTDIHLFEKCDDDKIEICNKLLDNVRLDDDQNSKEYCSQNDLTKEKTIHVDKKYSYKDDICDELSTSSTDETVILDEVLDSNEQTSPDSHSSQQKDTKAENTKPSGNTNIVLASTNHLSLARPECVKANDTKETLEESLDMSTSDMEMEPCIVLLENLPLALTDEELQDTVEPYGEMETYIFHIKEDSKTCSIKMPSSMGGELLVVSLDGLEVDGVKVIELKQEWKKFEHCYPRKVVRLYTRKMMDF